MAGEGVWVPAHKRHVGYVAQDGALFPHLNVGQNISFGLDAAKLPGGHRGVKSRVAELLEMVSLDPAMAKRRPHQLSGGQQQRVALARALAREPELMLLDEPFSALDAGLRVATRRAVGKVLHDAGVTTILVTHDQGEALSFADQVAVMRGGRLAQIGNPFIVYTRPADRATAEFLGDAVILDAWMEGSLATCSLGGIPVRRPPAQGRVQLMLRPEQIRIAEDGPIRGVVVDTDYFGPGNHRAAQARRPARPRGRRRGRPPLPRRRRNHHHPALERLDRPPRHGAVPPRGRRGRGLPGGRPAAGCSRRLAPCPRVCR